jgi:hypothetical protein
VVCSVGAGCGAAIAVEALLAGARGSGGRGEGFGGGNWRSGGAGGEGVEFPRGPNWRRHYPDVVGPCLAYLWEASSSGEAVWGRLDSAPRS